MTESSHADVNQYFGIELSHAATLSESYPTWHWILDTGILTDMTAVTKVSCLSLSG
ncbi:MAG: hypothetical protein WCP01_07940 [Methylococcaceae bacterium]